MMVEFLRSDWFYLLLVFIDSLFMARPYLYAIQQDNYRVGEIFKNRRLKVVFLIDMLAVGVFTLIWVALYIVKANAFWGFLSVLFFFIAEFAMYFMEDLPTRKKPLKYTKRAVRCLVCVAIVATVTVGVAITLLAEYVENLYFRFLALFVFPIFFPLVFMLATSVINLFEKCNNRRYETKTLKTLAGFDNLIKIAITGSCGKTSVKNYLCEILSQKYNVLATPESFNTPMGIAKTVKQLDVTHDVFIAEMGARRVGDIKKLMKIVKPAYSILTQINSQHLETFKSEDNIKKEKCKVLGVQRGGFCVVNDTLQDVVSTNFDNKGDVGIYYAGFDENSNVYATNINVGESGCAFDLVIDGVAHRATTKLIGTHNIQNIVMSACCAYQLGVEIVYILNAIENLQAVPHRMQLIQGEGIKIIDDSFNSNVDGAKMAIETLGCFEGRKVVLTPGLVELGVREGEENFKLGEQIASVADLVMLVGVKRTDAIRRGLLNVGFGGEIHIYESLADAQKDFPNRLKVNDVLLILNDLPDVYDDKK